MSGFERAKWLGAIRRVAALLLAGLGLFYFWGTAHILQHLLLEREANLPLFGVYHSYDDPPWATLRGMAVMATHWFIAAYAMRLAAEGVWRASRLASVVSAAILLLLMALRWGMLRNNSQAQAEGWGVLGWHAAALMAVAVLKIVHHAIRPSPSH